MSSNTSGIISGELQGDIVIIQGIKRADIKPGLLVRVVTKEDQRSGRLTEGVVKDILTKSPTHPHGIKVRLESGIVGRVKDICHDIQVVTIKTKYLSS